MPFSATPMYGSDDADPLRMFLSRNVPPGDPSLIHGSNPFVPSSADHTSLLPNGSLTSLPFPESPVGLTSLTNVSVDPSYVHSSRPWVSSVAEKNMTLLMTAHGLGSDDEGPG